METVPAGLGHTTGYNECVPENNRLGIRRRNCMKQYETKEILEVKKVICNKCGKEIVVENGRLTEDMLQIEKRWGYRSKKIMNCIRLICVSNVMMNLPQLFLFL